MKQATCTGLACWPIAALAAMPATAHHSPAAYDLDATMAIEGVVTKFEWASPHVYVFVSERGSDDAENVWTIEAFAPTTMKGAGWSPDTLAAGDRVVVVGSPGRNRARRIAMLRSVTKDGSQLSVEVPLAAQSGPPVAASAAPPPAPTFEATNLSGNWAPLPGAQIGRFLGRPASLPLTAQARAALARFTNNDENPGRDCVPFPAPLYMLLDGLMNIEVRDGIVAIRGEDSAVERVVHIGASTHDGAGEAIQGHSIGRWEEDVLVVDTARFAPHRLGIAAGVPSSAQKRLVERFALTADRTALIYGFELEDPEYLTEPVTAFARWIYRPDLEHTPTPCDLENARRFLSGEENE